MVFLIYFTKIIVLTVCLWYIKIQRCFQKEVYSVKKIDPTILKETCYIATMVFIFSLALQSVFLIIGKWDYTVLTGNLLGFVAAVGNFFLMGLTVQSSLGKEEKDAKNLMKVSQSLRLLLIFVIALIGYLVPVFNTIAVLIPLLFPRIAVALRPLFMKKR